MSDETVIEGHPVVPEPDRKMITPGANVRIFRDGEVLHSQINAPARGPIELRHLPPGSYVLKDEEGGYAEVAVDPFVETTVVHTNASRRQARVEAGTAEPGSSYVIPAPKPAEALRPIYPDRADQLEPEEHPSVDVPVLGEPGSSVLTEEEIPDEDPQLERLRPGYEAPNAQTDPVSDEVPDEQKPDQRREEEPREPDTTVEQATVIDPRKRPVDPSLPDPKAGEIASTVMPGEQVTEDPAPTSSHGKLQRAVKPTKRPPADG
jgi:hypothetical protein